MVVQRGWVTPLAAGAFILSAVTGVLIFFHVDTGLNKLAHEWLSWVLLGAIVLHLIVNQGGLKRHLKSRSGQVLLGLFALLLALSFFSPGVKKEPPFMAPVRALAVAPLPAVAQVAGVDTLQLKQKLVKIGVVPNSEQQSIQDLVGTDLREQMRILGLLLGKAG